MTEAEAKHVRDVIVEKARLAKEAGKIDLAKWFMSLIFDPKGRLA